jgi:predicted alpha-1,2-mannosidase
VVDPVSLVNPLIGTAGGGDTFPGADVPFGMVQWSPDTGTDANGGSYSYQSPSIIGYGLTQLSGAGCPAEGDVPILPTSGAVGADPAGSTEPLVHSLETATPGYYRLDAGGIDTRLTATTRSGMATFTFPTSSPQGNLLFKLSGSATSVTASRFRIVSSKEVAGSITTGNFCGGSNVYTLHFDMVFNRAMASSGTWSSGGNGAYVTFDTSADPVVEAKVGISYVSTADAVVNRTDEDPGWSFGSVEAAAQGSWRTMLGKVQVRGGTAAQRTIFATALYHSLLEPTVFSDDNGRYMGFDGQVHRVTAGQRAQYANYSGWDIYRSEIPLEAMLAPAVTSDVVTSMLNDYRQVGEFPKWAEDGGEDFIMVGDPADGIIADAHAFGATRFDTGEALADMETEADVPNNVRPGLDYYEQDGFLPVDGTYGCCNFYGPVSTQEEYDTADDAIAHFAAALGDRRVASDFASRAQNWQNVFDPASGFLQPKESTGVFQPGFSPLSQDGFVEADSFVYTASIPFDLAGVIAADGGDAAWVKALDTLTSSVTAGGPTQIQMGDEPSFAIPWEYDYAGAPDRTQQVVRAIQDGDFTDTPGGLPGNDDLGATSSWYVWSALGGYPETPGSAVLALGSPLFTTITVHLADGRTLRESTSGAGDADPYVDGLTVDGTSWGRAYLPAATFDRGGTLRWRLGAGPTNWGSAAGDAPPSDHQGLLPALGYLAGPADGQVSVAPGATASLTLGVQGMAGASLSGAARSGTGQPGAAQRISWTASSPGSDLGVEPSAGTVAVSGEARSTQLVTLRVAPTTPPGQYTVRFALRAASGVALPDVVAQVDVS